MEKKKKRIRLVRGVKKAYPQSNSIFKEGDGHLMYFNVFY